MKYVVYTATRNYYEDTIPSMKSLLSHTHIDKVYFLIEDDVFPYWLPDCVEVINVSDQEYFHKDGPNYTNPWTWAVLMRAAFTKIIPVDKVLNLDADVFIEDDISELWDLDIDNYYFAGVTEFAKKGFEQPYINFGVCMMNLKKLRDGKDDEIIRELNTNHYFANEQDVFNTLCRQKLAIQSKYNSCLYTKPCENPKIVHYAGIGDIFPWSGVRWQDFPLAKKYQSMDWKII